MCGFIGYISKKNNNKNFIYEQKFEKYFELLENRGPDYKIKKKIYSNNSLINIGFLRLAVQDLSSKSNQIFMNEKKILLFNGEIYNKHDLYREYLNNKILKTNSDTEVLFYLLDKYGSSIISKLSGIFSIIFINIESNDVFAIKDITGTKPLYYKIEDGNFFFSSEAWFLYSLSDKKINSKALSFYFNYGFTPPGETIIETIKKIKPAEIIKFNFNLKKLNSETYFDFKKDKKKKLSDQESINQTIKDTIKMNLLSDAKIGTFLSGGIDSSTITILAKQLNNDVESFTTFYLPDKKFDKFNVDFKYSKRVAKDFNIKLNVKYVETEKEFYNDFLKVTSYFDEPVSNLNFMNSYWQSKMAKENGAKVVLTGDGADELFCGYDRYKKSFIANKLSMFSFANNKINKYNKLKDDEMINFFHSKFKIFDLKNLFYNTDDFLDDYKFEILNNTNFNNNIDKINYFDIYYWLSSENNYKLDKTTMINSVEARVPFQDIKLFEKLYYVNNFKKINLFDQKFLIKNLNILPNYVKKRKKQGWFSPEKIFLDLFLNDLESTFFNEKKIKSQQIINFEFLKKLIDFYKSDSRAYEIKNQLLSIIIFQIWYENILKL